MSHTRYGSRNNRFPDLALHVFRRHDLDDKQQQQALVLYPCPTASASNATPESGRNNGGSHPPAPSRTVTSLESDKTDPQSVRNDRLLPKDCCYVRICKTRPAFIHYYGRSTVPTGGPSDSLHTMSIPAPPLRILCTVLDYAVTLSEPRQGPGDGSRELITPAIRSQIQLFPGTLTEARQRPMNCYIGWRELRRLIGLCTKGTDSRWLDEFRSVMTMRSHRGR